MYRVRFALIIIVDYERWTFGFSYSILISNKCCLMNGSVFDCQGADADLRTSVTNFRALVLALLKDPVEKAYFFQVRHASVMVRWDWLICCLSPSVCVSQEVFPLEYGARFDTALKELMWELLSCLENLLPVPDFKKVDPLFVFVCRRSDTLYGCGTVRFVLCCTMVICAVSVLGCQTLAWLGPAPAGLEDCMQTDPIALQLLLQQHQLLRHAEKGRAGMKQLLYISLTQDVHLTAGGHFVIWYLSGKSGL